MKVHVKRRYSEEGYQSFIDRPSGKIMNALLYTLLVVFFGMFVVGIIVGNPTWALFIPMGILLIPIVGVHELRRTLNERSGKERHKHS